MKIQDIIDKLKLSDNAQICLNGLRLTKIESKYCVLVNNDKVNIQDMKNNDSSFYVGYYIKGEMDWVNPVADYHNMNYPETRVK